MMLDADPFAPLDAVARAPVGSRTGTEKPDKEPILPVPGDAPPCDLRIPAKGGAPVKLWAYRDVGGQLLGYDARFEYEADGKPCKDVMPITYCQVGSVRRWGAKSLPKPRALYGLDRLSARPDAPVVIAEGCKSADAAGELLPTYVAVSWQGGGKAVAHSNWQALAGREVLVWPDRDRQKSKRGKELPYLEQPGTITASEIARQLGPIAGQVRVLDLEDHDCASGWDAADALQAGMSCDEAAEFVRIHAVDAKATTRPSVRIQAGELNRMATEAEEALIAGGAPIYNRGGLCRPVIDEVAAADGGRTKVARLVQVDATMLVDHLSRCSDWVKWNARKDGWVAADPPLAVASIVLSRDGEWSFPSLSGIITAPTIRPDGTLLLKPGFDPQTRLLLLDPPAMPEIPDKPTREQAMLALVRLDRLLDGFPFDDAPSRSVALSGLITPVVRGAMAVAPLHVASAPVPGSGKSYLVDLFAAILTGDRAPVIPAGQTDEETEKRLGAALLNGFPIVSIDNVNGQLGGDMLCQLIERPVVSLRPLGVSKLVRVESRASCFATGNNIQLVGDMTRRTLLCTLDPKIERPEMRQFSTNPFGLVVAHRGAYIAAALTVVRAYIVAGCPDPMPALASFETWSRYVRSALVWLGRADPLQTIEAARASDPVITKLRAVLNTWHAAIGEAARTTGQVRATAITNDHSGNLLHPDLREALVEVADDRRGGINPKSLGIYLKRHEGRVVDNFRIGSFEDTHNKQKVWQVKKV